MVGFNPFEKYACVKLDHFPRDQGFEHKKIYEKPPPVIGPSSGVLTPRFHNGIRWGENKTSPQPSSGEASLKPMDSAKSNNLTTRVDRSNQGDVPIQIGMGH